MPRPHDAEVAAVERRHFGRVEPLGHGDHRGVDGAQRQVAVLGDELGDADRVACVQRLDEEVTGGEVAEEANLRLPSESGADQIGDLGDDERGEDERPRMGLEQLQAGRMMVVVGVDVGVERPGVEDQRDGAISEERISSIRSETSLWPLRPLAAAPRRRRPPVPRCCSSAVRVTSAIVTPRRSASWRSRASSSSGSFTVVLCMGCQHTRSLQIAMRLFPRIAWTEHRDELSDCDGIEIFSCFAFELGDSPRAEGLGAFDLEVASLDELRGSG
jgi:hypothetical protein